MWRRALHADAGACHISPECSSRVRHSCRTPSESCAAGLVLRSRPRRGERALLAGVEAKCSVRPSFKDAASVGGNGIDPIRVKFLCVAAMCRNRRPRSYRVLIVTRGCWGLSERRRMRVQLRPEVAAAMPGPTGRGLGHSRGCFAADLASTIRAARITGPGTLRPEPAPIIKSLAGARYPRAPIANESQDRGSSCTLCSRHMLATVSRWYTRSDLIPAGLPGRALRTLLRLQLSVGRPQSRS
jgi:hypothetical protein